MKRQTVPKEWKEKLGYRCYNCGCEENIEYHHIVPMFLGGNDVITNVVPLCNKCHKVAHKGRHMSHYTNKINSGRKKLCDDETVRRVADMYINGEIGNRKAVELVNGKPGSRFTGRRSYRAYIQELGIRTVRNFVDYLAENTYDGLVEGKDCVEIDYLNGKYERRQWHDTGKNDVEYVKSAHLEKWAISKEDADRAMAITLEREKLKRANIVAMVQDDHQKPLTDTQDKRREEMYERWRKEYKIG